MALGFNSVDSIKNEIISSMGKDIEIREFNKQKKLVKEVHGTIIGSFENVFLVETMINSYKIKKSYTYNEFLTHDLHYDILGED